MLYNTLSAPITAQVELTTGCDNDCMYCYNHWRHDKNVPGANMHRDLLNDVIHELLENKVFQVTFTGGEVLLRKEELFYGLEKLIQGGVSCAVNSNLTLLTAEDAKHLYDLGLRGIMTSISSHESNLHDYISHRPGAYEKTMQGVRNAQEAGLFVAVSMVVTTLNANQVYETGIAMEELGIREFYATKASPPVNASGFQQYLLSKEQLQSVLEDLYRLKKESGIEVGVLECYPLCGHGEPERFSFVSDRRCSAGVTTCTIGADGNIRPCSHSEKEYGNVTTDGLAVAWENMTDQRDGSLLPGTCKTCDLLPNCSGGCRVDALCCNGSYDTLDPYASPEKVKTIEIHSQLPDPLPSGTQLQVTRPLYTREETFGVLCATGETMAMPALLTNDTHALLNTIGDATFTAEKVSEMTGATPLDASVLCAMLLRDKVITKTT